MKVIAFGLNKGISLIKGIKERTLQKPSALRTSLHLSRMRATGHPPELRPFDSHVSHSKQFKKVQQYAGYAVSQLVGALRYKMEGRWISH
jgi:hypothetical protein